MQKLDEQIITFIIIGNLLILSFVALLVYVLLRSANRQSRSILERQQLQFEHRNQRVREVERVVNEISREIHDNIGQMASAIRMSLYAVKRFAVDPKQIEYIGDIEMLADKLIQDAENISKSMNTEYIKATGFHQSLQKILKQTETYNNMACSLAINGEIRSLFPETKLLILRIAQEAIHNIIKHAHATEMKIELDYQG